MNDIANDINDKKLFTLLEQSWYNNTVVLKPQKVKLLLFRK